MEISMTAFTMPLIRRLGLAVFLAGAAALPAVAADTYTFDKAHTEIRFSWSHFGISRTAATFLDYDGQLAIDPAAPETSQLDVTIKVPGISSRVAKFDEHLKSADFFDAAKFGEITFKSTKVEKTGDKTAKVTGTVSKRHCRSRWMRR
jgi:polyisoprenoid-binding protein YceI